MGKIADNRDNLIVNIWFALKRSLVLVIAMMLVCTALGTAYGFIKKPNYTATEKVVFTAEAEDETKNNIVTNFNIMSAYINTIVDFCDEGVVVDRANFYYAQYMQRIQPGSPYIQESEYTVEDFIYDIDYVEDPYSTETSVSGSIQYIARENVYVSAQVETEKTDEYAFSLGYTDGDKEQASIKAKIYLLAFRREIQPPADKPGIQYFDGIKITILGLDANGVTSDVSKVKFAAIGFVIGIVLSALAVYVINVTDVTIKSKDDLEDLTGTTVLAYIDDVGGKK